MTIGEALKSLRLHAGMTQTQTAAGIVTESFYSKVETRLMEPIILTSVFFFMIIFLLNNI